MVKKLAFQFPFRPRNILEIVVLFLSHSADLIYGTTLFRSEHARPPRRVIKGRPKKSVNNSSRIGKFIDGHVQFFCIARRAAANNFVYHSHTECPILSCDNSSVFTVHSAHSTHKLSLCTLSAKNAFAPITTHKQQPTRSISCANKQS